MNWIKDKKTRQGLALNLLASVLFLAFVQPIMNFIWDVLREFSTSTYDGFINTMYSNAAQGQRNWIDFLFLVIFSILATFAIVEIMDKAKRLVNKILDERKMEGLSDEKLKEELTLSIDKLEKSIYKTENFFISFVKYTSLPLIIFTIICSIVLVFISYTELQLNTSFNQRLNALAPYTTDHEIKLLKSKWALMERRSDFLEINIHMDSLAKGAKIVLPENLLK